MTIRDIISLLDAEIISAADLDLEVKTACGSDMMSDVLAFVKELAKKMDITLLKTRYRLFTACGKLYENGLRGGCE